MVDCLLIHIYSRCFYNTICEMYSCACVFSNTWVEIIYTWMSATICSVPPSNVWLNYIPHEQVTNKSHTGTDTQFCITVKNTSLLGSCSCSSQISFVGHSFSILQLTFNFFIYLPKLLYNTFELSVHGPLSEAQLYRRTRSSCVSTTCTQNISPKLLSYIKLSLPWCT